MNDPLLDVLQTLPRAEADALHAGRVRARCCGVLERRHAPPADTHARPFGSFEYAVSAFCLAYVTSVIAVALRLSRVF